MKINNAHVLSGTITIPQKPEQKKIVQFITSIDQKIESVNTQLINTQAFKKGLLQQMFV